MKRFLLSLAVGVSLLLAHAPAFAMAQEGIAAVVNDAVITVTDVKDRTNLYISAEKIPPSPEQRTKVEQQVLSRLIDEALQIQEAKKLGITISDNELNEGFADVAKRNGLSPEDFRKRLTESGARIESLYTQIKADLAWSQVVRRRISPQVSISESDIDLTMEQIAHAVGKPQYLVAEIFLNVPSPEKENGTRDQAEKLVRQITAGASFSSVAREFSQAPGAASGGDLGWLQEGQLDKDLNQALEKMHPGQISPPIRTAKGYHILFLRELRQGDDSAAAKTGIDKSDDASRDKIANKLGTERLDQMAMHYLRDLRATAFIDKRI